jgi:hypothetical protein
MPNFSNTDWIGIRGEANRPLCHSKNKVQQIDATPQKVQTQKRITENCSHAAMPGAMASLPRSSCRH